MAEVYVIGIGMIRFGKYLDATIKGMAAEAVTKVLQDSGVEKGDLEAAYVSNTFWGMYNDQHSIRGEVMLYPLGIQGIPIVNTENACAGASTAFHLAYTAVRAEMCEVALTLGVEKITHADKMVSFKSYATCLDVEGFAQHMQSILEMAKHIPMAEVPPEFQDAGGARSVFMDIYAAGARWHMAKYGSTQRQLAVISSKNHFHSSLNPLAQIQKDMTVEDVLADKLVAWPLTRPMCAPIGDGAAAAILCSEKFLRKLKRPRAVRIRASVLGSGTNRGFDDGVDIGERLSKLAYERSGVGPRDIDVAELHDATAYGELHQSEVMGFCPEGGGGPFAETGATRLGGKVPINTSGGLESRGHPIGASGLAQIHEIVTQLRGEAGKRQVNGARIGLTENGGGNLGVEEASMTVHILERAF